MQQTAQTDWHIDLRAVIKDKSPALSRMIPGFLLRPFARFLHIGEINEFNRLHGEKRDFAWIDAALDYVPVKVEAIGLENIPTSGGAIIASNHPLGGPDALGLIQQVARVRRDQHFLVNDILMNLTTIQNLFVPVNKHGRNNREVIKVIDEAFASDKLTLIFPAGLVSRKQNHGIEDLDWHKSFIRQAVKHKRDVIPVFIAAQNSPRFYNFANWRKKLKIKANLEMLFLPAELFRQSGNTIQIYFGKAVPWTTFTKEKTHEEWATLFKKHVYALPSGQSIFLEEQK